MPAKPAGTGPGGARSAGKCPICGRPSVDRYRPFCSRRCADIDLARWLSGGYAIPDEESEDGMEGADVQGPGVAPGEDNGKAGKKT
jgi:uncharacterized protein